MGFIKLTRPDDSAVYVNVDEILSFAAVPAGSGTLTTGARIAFRTNGHQDVREPPEAIAKLILLGSLGVSESPGEPEALDAAIESLDDFLGQTIPLQLPSADAPTLHRFAGHPEWTPPPSPPPKTGGAGE